MHASKHDWLACVVNEHNWYNFDEILENSIWISHLQEDPAPLNSSQNKHSHGEVVYNCVSLAAFVNPQTIVQVESLLLLLEQGILLRDVVAKRIPEQSLKHRAKAGEKGETCQHCLPGPASNALKMSRRDERDLCAWTTSQPLLSGFLSILKRPLKSYLGDYVKILRIFIPTMAAYCSLVSSISQNPGARFLPLFKNA